MSVKEVTINADDLKLFIELTGLGAAHYLALLIMAGRGKTLRAVYHSGDSRQIGELLKEGYLEKTELSRRGQIYTDYELSAEGKELLKRMKKNSAADDVVTEVLEHLMGVKVEAGLKASLSPTGRTAQKSVKGLLSQGYTSEDIKLVNSYFTAQWKDDSWEYNGKPSSHYIRPSTLYNEKFDTRLEEAQQHKPQEKDSKWQDFDVIK